MKNTEEENRKEEKGNGRFVKRHSQNCGYHAHREVYLVSLRSLFRFFSALAPLRLYVVILLSSSLSPFPFSFFSGASDGSLSCFRFVVRLSTPPLHAHQQGVERDDFIITSLFW
jgi:hypothetical protein